MKLTRYYKDTRTRGQSAVRKAQLVELHLLAVVKRICEENGLRFFLAYGTLLGALRHSGFVPWDDDCDIFMLRDDFDKFIEIAKRELPDDVYLELPDDNPRMENGLVRLRDNYSLGMANHPRRLLLTDHLGIALDVFVLDYAGRKNPFSVWALHRSRSDAGWMRRAGFNRVTIWNLLVKWGWSIRVWGERLLWRASQMFAKPSWLIPSTWYLAWRQWYRPEWFLGDDGGQARVVMFEGEPYPVPAAAERILEETYGDWRSLPPEECRKGYLSVILPETACFHRAAMRYEALADEVETKGAGTK